MPWKVVAVSEQTRPWNSQKGGPMVSYKVHLQDTAGVVTQNVELAQKQSSAPPAVGQVLEGNVDQGDYGPKFRKAFQQGGGGRGMSPEDRASIVRQHSQDMSLRALELAYALGVIEKPATAREFLELVEKTTDWFVKDARKVVS